MNLDNFYNISPSIALSQESFVEANIPALLLVVEPKPLSDAGMSLK